MSLVIDYTSGFFETTPSGEGVGSITGNATLDLTSGNVFSHTPTANTTFAFSNPPASGTGYDFTLKVTGANVVDGYDLANASYDNVSLSVSSLSLQPADLSFSPDGTKIYISDPVTNAPQIEQATLSTAWDISTAGSFTSINLSGLTYGPNSAIRFNADGTSAAFVVYQGLVYQATLSTAYDLTTSGTWTQVLTLGASDFRDLLFNSSGTSVYFLRSASGNITRYPLSTAYDISSYGTPDSSVNLSSISDEQGFQWNNDGTKLFVISGSGGGSNAGKITEFSLTTTYDLSTLSSGTSYTISNSQEADPHGLFFKPDGSKLYVIGLQNDTVFQYTTGSSALATIAWPASVEWPSGAAPAAPASGETDIYTFFTTDGGSTYYGNQVGDAVS